MSHVGDRPGDVTWIRDENSNWWPAQIVDEKTVCEDHKPKRDVVSKTLVRVYGTYNYVYIDLLKCKNEFDKAFKQNIDGVRKIFLEALKVTSQKYDQKSQMNSLISGSKDPMEVDTKKKQIKKVMKNNNKEALLVKCARSTIKVDTNNKEGNEDIKDGQEAFLLDSEKSPPSNARRIRMMQNLGLIPPAGSPFSKNGLTEASLEVKS